MPTITLEDLQARQETARRQRNTADAYAHKPVPHSFQSAPQEPQAMPNDLADVFAKIAELTARCDALIERNGRWTRYVTGGDNAQP